MATRFIRHFLLALQFFTRIPVTGALARWVGYSPAMLRASAAHFPGIGWLTGLASAGVFAATLLLLPDTTASVWVAAVLSTLITVWMTGGFHEDGLADLSDGLGGAVSRERALEIMKDSRLGTYGVLALVLALALKLALLAVLGEQDLELACGALFMAHVSSRTWPLLLIVSLPHVGDAAGSKSKPLADQISPTSLAAASLWFFGAWALVQWAYPDIDLIAPLLASAVGLLAMWRLLVRRLQGFTGDALGATQQVCELMFYLGLALSL